MKFHVLTLIAVMLCGCTASQGRVMPERDIQLGTESMLLAFSVAQNDLLQMHEVLLELEQGTGIRKEQRLQIPAKLESNEILVFRVPRSQLSLAAIVLKSGSGRTKWITDGKGPDLVPPASGGIYLGRIGVQAIRYLPYDDEPHKRPEAIKIIFADASAEDFPKLANWAAFDGGVQLEKIVFDSWSSEQFVNLRLMPSSRDAIHHRQRLENIFCLPKIHDFDEYCRE